MYVCNIFFEGELGSLTVNTTKDPDSIFEGTDDTELKGAGDDVFDDCPILEIVAISAVGAVTLPRGWSLFTSVIVANCESRSLNSTSSLVSDTTRLRRLVLVLDSIARCMISLAVFLFLWIEGTEGMVEFSRALEPLPVNTQFEIK